MHEARNSTTLPYSASGIDRGTHVDTEPCVDTAGTGVGGGLTGRAWTGIICPFVPSPRTPRPLWSPKGLRYTPSPSAGGGLESLL